MTRDDGPGVPRRSTAVLESNTATPYAGRCTDTRCRARRRCRRRAAPAGAAGGGNSRGSACPGGLLTRLGEAARRGGGGGGAPLAHQPDGPFDRFECRLTISVASEIGRAGANPRRRRLAPTRHSNGQISLALMVKSRWHSNGRISLRRRDRLEPASLRASLRRASSDNRSEAATA